MTILNLTTQNYTGSTITHIIPALAALRIRVFQDYPYLYQGSLDYEADYLKHYAECEKSLVVIVQNQSEIVGASTAMPLLDYGDDVSTPFEQAGYDTSTIFYFGESVLDKKYRGMGFGKRFFIERETWAKHCGYKLATFCAVNRQSDDPRQPAGYKPLNTFWEHLGYQKQTQLQCEFSWTEIGETEETPKKLTFWTKQLDV